jgi:hypothetical protein
MVSSTEAKDANNLRGWALAPGSDCDDLPPLSGWRVSDGKGFAPDDGITVTHSNALKVQLAVSVALSVRTIVLLLSVLFCDVLARCCNRRWALIGVYDFHFKQLYLTVRACEICD